MKKFSVTLLALFLASMSYGQLKQGAWGVQTAISGGTPSLGIAYAISPNLRLGGVIGFGTSSFAGTSSSAFSVGVAPWYYLGTSENVSAFVGGMLAFTSTSPGGGAPSASGFNIAGHFGAEYWFSPKFSWSGFLGLGFSSSGPSGATTSTFGTSTNTGLTWYF